MSKKIPYNFVHLQTAIIAFIADFELKVHQVYPNIPVLMENIDDSYIFLKKYAKTELEELYNTLPRIVLSFQDVQAQIDLNSTQFLRMNYEFNDKEYNTQFRRVSTGLTVNINFICSSYIKSLEYWEFLVSLICIDNVYTYQHFGNTYQGGYLMSNSPNIDKGQLNNGTSETKNFNVTCSLDLNIQPTFVNFNTITDKQKSSFLIDSDIIDIIGDNSGSAYTSDIDDSGNEIITNSKINTTQDYNDLNVSDAEEKKLLKNRKRVKKGNNVFDIESKISKDESLTYKTTMKTDIYQHPEENE